MRIRFGAKQVYSTHQQFVLFLHSLVDVISNAGNQFLSLYMPTVHYFLHTIEPLHQGKDGRLRIGDIIGELLS